MLIIKLHSIHFPIKMDNCGDLNSFQIKLEQTELIIKDEPEEVAIENSSFDVIFDKRFPTLGIKDPLLNTQVNVDNLDFDALEVKLKEEELIIKDAPEEVVENTSSLEIIKFDTSPLTLGIRDHIANTLIKVDSSIRKIEDLLNICTCTVELNRIYKGIKRFKCEQCNKCFTLNSNLKRHMLIHKGLKPFKCQQCDRCFSQNGNLKKHLLIHKGLKPFKCQQCNKCFTANSSLKNHMLIHKGLKHFKCQQCNKGFAQNSYLKTHMLIHKGLKPFKCQQCNKCFTLNSDLKRHMLIHKGLKPFKCPECNNTLKKHMLIHLQKLIDDLEQEEDESEEAT